MYDLAQLHTSIKLVPEIKIVPVVTSTTTSISLQEFLCDFNLANESFMKLCPAISVYIHEETLTCIRWSIIISGIDVNNLLLVKDKQTVKSMVVGRPILLALEEVDGSPSFLEKALRFIEEYGKFLSMTVAILSLKSHDDTA